MHDIKTPLRHVGLSLFEIGLSAILLGCFFTSSAQSTRAQTSSNKHFQHDIGDTKPDVQSVTAQESIKSFSPDLLAPPVRQVGAIKGPSHRPPAFRQRWLTLNKVSIAALVGGEAIDSWGTYRNMTHTKWICGNSPAFTGGYDTNVPGEISSLRDVQVKCSPGPTGQTANWVFDVTRIGYFSEGGWVTQFHLADERNYAGVEGWNIANDVAWYLLARHLGRRTDWIGKCGPILNLARGSIHLHLGIGNLAAVRNEQDPNTLDLHVPKDSNYTSPRWWGKR